MELWEHMKMSDKGKCGNSGPGYAKNPEYRITLKPAGKNVRVEVGDKVIVESENALLMLEQNHQAVCYFPQSEVRMEHFQRTDHVTHCPFKGDASYWSLTVAGRELENIMWSYETPCDEVAAIKEYVAFYRTRLDNWYEDGELIIGSAQN
jgi:uncharacterized protein (DUF427 family)|tara:strand:- start:84 stop:533 length:450 start_codon:yes stop_codon:yes gene_type:complete